MTNDQLSLSYEIRGYLSMLRQCCDGRNVHAIATLRTALQLADHLLNRDRLLDPDRLDQLKRSIRGDIGPRVKKHYAVWLKHRERELAPQHAETEEIKP